MNNKRVVIAPMQLISSNCRFWPISSSLLSSTFIIKAWTFLKSNNSKVK